MSDDHEDEQPKVPTSADAAASQKALNSINAHTNDDDASAKNNIDKDAVKAAISEKKKPAAAPTVAVKVDEKDVKILMSQFEFTKQKATDVLKHNKGELKTAATAVIRGEA
ncbi:hypothetical protein BJ508DRAFT_360062 [Ascobolus immersus RN42]|uniref:Nascent polypeptide-associated complex subunit alpha-like UBA domain-containing protein n=1 Tax=Ascobolus immersus RN42 TaxID=1160509 RepID=A0A3N4IIT7_ASCIM|nr:hypothetical protein BJ508DRAFT_360062 [Ascobolus immersus RN42]